MDAIDTVSSGVVPTEKSQTRAERHGARDAETRAAWRQGVLTMLPILVSYVPFGLVVGHVISASPAPFAAWSGTWTIYGGAAHLTVVEAIGGGGSVLLAVAAAILVNARLAAYSTSLAPVWAGASRWQRFLAAVMLTDAVWALVRARRRDMEVGRSGSGESGGSEALRELRSFQFGAALTLWFGWPSLLVAGALAGSALSRVPGIDLAAPILLGTMIVRRRTR